MKGQSKKHSMAEALINVAVGYTINLCAQIIIFPQFGAYFTFFQNIEIGLLFTGISIVRTYVLRRLFNRIMIGHIA